MKHSKDRAASDTPQRSRSATPVPAEVKEVVKQEDEEEAASHPDGVKSRTKSISDQLTQVNM